MELIKIETDGSKRTVNARDLHGLLDAKQDFSNWMKVQIERARLVENRDFILLAKKGEQKGSGGHNKVDYHITIDAAKHVAMMSGTDKGFEVRDYFIECERRALAPSYHLPTTFHEALRMLADSVETLEKQRPLVEFAEAVNNSSGSMDLGSFAKILGTGRTRLFKWLRENDYLMANGKPYQEHIDRGLFVVIETLFHRGEIAQTYAKSQITGKGQVVVQRKFENRQ